MIFEADIIYGWFMNRSKPGSPKARSLAAELRKLRQDADVGVRELARRIGTSHGWVTRTESGSRSISVADVTSILAALEISSEDRERLVDMAREADQPDWLRPGIPGVREELVTLIEYERTATHFVEAAPLLIPGILQTADYARAIMSGLPAGEREAKVGMRAARRDVLTKVQAPVFEAFILEHVLRDSVCDASAHADQLRHLLKMAELPNVSIRALPKNLGWTHLHSGHFIHFEFGDAAPIVHLETLGSGVFLSSPGAISNYTDAMGSLRQAAMTEQETAEFITSIMERLEEST
ncbi:Helix-turn-helix domain-containing protein [Actinopolyspora mzabensis]|uniref:Helix-turn-helix domain-containing protein n=1 Tax=Actinopolyspora mzabensis TaxID=995066 RepID=A0A1G8X705_ACTMZ|nr:helix-turn-helix transcriptional regulator [Actinopolyspora mzabensis]SDJ86402.1 Helix-turn-helix domain-containing protein [Actinopolyspora mzabensis]